SAFEINFLYLFFTLPSGGYTKNHPTRPSLVGTTQSNVSIPSGTIRKKSSTSPTPSKCRGFPSLKYGTVHDTTSAIFSASLCAPPKAIASKCLSQNLAERTLKSSYSPPCVTPYNI